MPDMTILQGRYRHYKNRDYEVLGVATHTETGERLVVYRGLSQNQQLWVRPERMFEEDVWRDGVQVPRFRRIDP
jgi:hypothetical protein